MTPEQLESYITSADASGLVSAVKNLSEGERKKLSKKTSVLLRETKKAYNKSFELDFTVPTVGSALKSTFKRLVKNIKKKPNLKELFFSQYQVAQLASFAFCPYSEIRRVEFFGNNRLDELRLQIILDRKPEWVSKWIDHELDQEWIRISWQDLRMIIKSGLCEKPTVDGYVRLMLRGLPDYTYRKKDFKYTPISKKLKSEPELLEDEIWRLFHTETTAFSYDYTSGMEDLPADYETWTTALVNLVSEEVIDRQRVIDSCLSGITAGFTNNNTLSGYIKLHNLIKPSKEETILRQQKYLDLLSHSASHVVSFALKKIKEINKFKKLNDETFIGISDVLMTSRVKGQTKDCLAIFQQILKRKSELRFEILKTLAQGLQHESADIQEKTIDILEQWVNEKDPKLTKLLTNYLADISPALKNRLVVVLNQTGNNNVDKDTFDNQEISIEQLDKYNQRINLLGEDTKRLVGINYALRAFEENTDCGPLDFEIRDIPILSGLKPVEPIQSLEELIETVSHAVEQVESAEEVERIIDGISRFCVTKPEDFNTNTAPLQKRINERGGNSRRGLFGDWNVPPQIAQLLLAWLCGNNKFVTPKYYKDNISPVNIIQARLHELTLRVLKNQKAPLLATPTHYHGWIDPQIFVDRVIGLQENQIEILKYDFIQALLRLAPDFKEKALARTDNIFGIYRDIIKWALGSSEMPKRIPKRDEMYWIAAGRVRNPKKALDEFQSFKTGQMCPDGLMPAKYEWKAFQRKTVNKWDKREYVHPALEISNGFEEKNIRFNVDVPTALLHVHNVHPQWNIQYGYRVYSPWLVHWCGMIWPQNTDAFSVASIKKMMQRMDMNSSMDEPNFAYFEMQFEPDRLWSEMTILMVWIGLASRDVDVRGHVIDLLAEAIQDGRVHAESVGKGFVKLCQGGWVKHNRIYDCLKEVSRLSQLHGYVIANILKKWLASQTYLPRDGHYLLSLLLELLSQFGDVLNDQQKQPLLNVKGSSKTAKLAKVLVDLKSDGTTNEFRIALSQQLNARIERAERWQKTLQK